MFRALLFWLCAVPATAHEFWIAPQSTQVAPGEIVEPTVMIGEGLEGQAHPFQPRAYAEAFWISPSHVEPLHLRRMSDGRAQLRAVEDGLHILAVATFPQTYTHPSSAAFNQYARAEAMSALVHTDPTGGPVQETYRRFSKTLIKVGRAKKPDRRIGQDYEWVRNSDHLTLFHLRKPLVGKKARLTCRKEDGSAFQKTLVTDQNGNVPFETTNITACLLSAVLLQKSKDTWESTWVSIHF